MAATVCCGAESADAEAFRGRDRAARAAATIVPASIN